MISAKAFDNNLDALREEVVCCFLTGMLLKQNNCI